MSAGKRSLDERMLRYLRAPRARGEDLDAIRLAPFVIHDTRRCVRSHLSPLNADDHIAEQVLGQGRKRIQRTYDLFKYLPQQREALARWATRLSGDRNAACRRRRAPWDARKGPSGHPQPGRSRGRNSPANTKQRRRPTSGGTAGRHQGRRECCPNAVPAAASRFEFETGMTVVPLHKGR
jgi:hypothetical protein